MGQRVWNQQEKIVDTLVASGTKAMTVTLDNAAAVDATGTGAPRVTFPATAHGFASGSQLYITGTTNYSGNRVLTAVATDTFTARADYVAETFAGTETASVILAPGVSFEIIEVRYHLSAAPTTSENFTITLDDNSGSSFDTLLYSQDFSATSATSLVWLPHWQLTFDPGDKLLFAFANTDLGTWGIEVKFRRINRVGG